jgi:integrase
LFLASVEVAKAKGEFVDVSAGRLTIGDLGREWFAAKASGMKPSSYRAIETGWRVYVEPRWGSTRVGEVLHSDVRTWVSQLGDGTAITDRSPKRRVSQFEARPKSATTVLRAYGILAALLDVAVRDRRISSNPARGLDNLPRKLTREHRYLDHEQVRALADAAGPDHGALVMVLAYCGLRWGEASALRVRDLDMLRRRINVRENAVLVDRSIMVGSPKSHERRSVPFPAMLDLPLAKACEGKGRDDLVFAAPAGGYQRRPNTSDGTTSWFIRALAASGLERMTVHDLRHTTASLAVSAGANVKAVQRMLGHKSAAMTLDTYADLFDDDLDAVATAMGNAAASADVSKMWPKRARDGA